MTVDNEFEVSEVSFAFGGKRAVLLSNLSDLRVCRLSDFKIHRLAFIPIEICSANHSSEGSHFEIVQDFIVSFGCFQRVGT